MWRIRTIKKLWRPLTAGLLALAFFLVGFPPQYLVEKISERNIIDPMYWAMKDGNVIDKGLSDLLKPRIERANAATFSIQTGYYIGNNTDNRAVTGLGFSPDLVLMKDNSTAGGGIIWKNSSMPGEETAYLTNSSANISTNAIQSFDSDGFTVGTNADTGTLNTYYSWIAFGGSDCTSSGTFCVGTYGGNGGAQSISTGFQPDLVAVKRNANSLGVWKSSAMAGNVTSYFSATAQDTGGTMIQTLNANGSFTVGNNTTVNRNGDTYYFFAFKQVAGAMDVGTYAGNGADNRNINSAVDAGLTFQPDFVFNKSAANTAAVYNSRESGGDGSFLFTDALRAVNYIQSLLPGGGFQVGTGSNAAVNHYYAAFGGAPQSSASGTFRMAEGSYTGTGGVTSITVPFPPDLVTIQRRNGAATYQHAVFRTRLMPGNSTAYFGVATANFTAGITALTATGFDLGTAAQVNTLNDTYHWVAYGNAWRPDTNSGAADFAIGAYLSHNVNPLTVRTLPFQPDLLVIKRNGVNYGVFRTSTMVGDITDTFSVSAAITGSITSLDANGFTLGNNTVINAGAPINQFYYYFAFKSGPNMTVNSYLGNNTDNTNINTVGFNPDFVWVKKRSGGTAQVGVMKAKTDSGEETRPFTNVVVTLIDAIQNFLGTNNGFQIGRSVLVNENTFTHDYVAWKIPLTFQQSAYRLFANVDTTNVGAALAAGDTGATLANTGDAFRLRMTIHVNGDTGGRLDTGEENFKLQFSSTADTCDTDFVGENYVDVTSATAISFKNNTPADGAALTNNANDPPVAGNPHAGHTIVNQTYEEANNFTNSIAAVPVDQDGKWDFALYDNGATGNTKYCFRAVKSDNTPLESYSVVPEITTTPMPTFTQNYFRFYQDNDALKPALPWAGLGEITNITAATEPLAVSEKLRLRMTLLSTTVNAPALSQSFRLQYGKQVTTCSALGEGSWANIGAPGSATAWRGVNATPVSGTALSAANPPTAGDLLISGSDRTGTYEESGGVSVSNPYLVSIGEEIEYDWILQNNGADAMSDYCFRMASTTAAVITSRAYYPTIRTAGFRPKTENWQWFDDEGSETPSVSLGNEEVSPSDIAYNNSIKLRVAVKETAAVAGSNVKFKLQFSEYSDFSKGVVDVVDQGTCTENSLWCFADGAGADNAVISSKKLTGVGACSGGVGAGCGTHNETPSTPSTFTQTSSATTEYEFTIRHAGARANRTYYFRLLDTVSGFPVPKDTGKSYPSLATEGAQLSFSVAGLPEGTNTEGTVTTISTSATSLPFGPLPLSENVTAAQRFTLSTNATEGYQIFVRALSDLISDNNDIIEPVTGTNAVPSLWSVGCIALASGCFGYHAGDDILSGGSTRFTIDGNFAKLSNIVHEEIAFSSVPVINESIDIVYQTKVTGIQPPGNYSTALLYTVVPVF
ncbi:MAG: hypothetical protein M0P76_05845 [Candidatus Pacebacteria bacterium]|jgi:hypothetical protein|nr:hypothetical protein [Candidatus Paceibacterota bacterium]